MWVSMTGAERRTAGATARPAGARRVDLTAALRQRYRLVAWPRGARGPARSPARRTLSFEADLGRRFHAPSDYTRRTSTARAAGGARACDPLRSAPARSTGPMRTGIILFGHAAAPRRAAERRATPARPSDGDRHPCSTCGGAASGALVEVGGRLSVGRPLRQAGPKTTLGARADWSTRPAGGLCARRARPRLAPRALCRSDDGRRGVFRRGRGGQRPFAIATWKRRRGYSESRGVRRVAQTRRA